MADPNAEPPFLRIGPEVPASPVVLSVPHAGRAYSRDLLKSSRLPLKTLEALEIGSSTASSGGRRRPARWR
jgi:hypothetical protein